MANRMTQRFRFTGEQQDPEVRGTDLGDYGGLYYLRARYYDPALGRFMSRDPLLGFLGKPQTLNAYAYAGNNPARYTDPTGLCFLYPGDCVPNWLEAGVTSAGSCLGKLDECAEHAAEASEDWLASVFCPEKGYTDVNFTAADVGGFTGGIQCSQQQGFFFYLGPAVGTGVGGSVTVAPGQSVTEGVFCGAQFGGGVAGYGAVGNVGFSGSPRDAAFFWEGGVGKGTTTGFVFIGACANVVDITPWD